MSNQINYRQKYQDLKMKFMESVDTAFRLGFEQGKVQAQQDQMMQQQQAKMELDQIGQGQGSEGSPAGEEQMSNPASGSDGQQVTQDSENPQGSELDQHIEKLESMLKSETPSNPAELMVLTKQIQKLRKSMKEAAELKKSHKAISEISKALHKPAFKIGVQASHNMNSNAKAAVQMQEKIVNDIMMKWEQEEAAASSSIQKILSSDLLTKKD